MIVLSGCAHMCERTHAPVHVGKSSVGWNICVKEGMSMHVTVCAGRSSVIPIQEQKYV